MKRPRVCLVFRKSGDSCIRTQLQETQVWLPCKYRIRQRICGPSVIIEYEHGEGNIGFFFFRIISRFVSFFSWVFCLFVKTWLKVRMRLVECLVYLTIK